SGSLIFQPLMLGALPPDQRRPTPHGLQLVTQVVQMCGSFLLSLLLLIGGIGLLKRRPWSRSSHLLWAVLKVLLTAVGFAVGLLFADEMVKQINDQLSGNGQKKPPFTLTKQMFVTISVV